MLGYCATGSTVIDTRPASVMMIATTAAKIGRSMKNRENIERGRGLLADGDVDAARLIGAAASRDGGRRRELDALRRDAAGQQGIPHSQRAFLGEVHVAGGIAARVGITRHGELCADAHGR